MRACPFCAQSVQDEAIVCRYCGLDLELPDWLRGKRRCPFCAEFISVSSTDCPYCKSPLDESFRRDDAAGDSVEDFQLDRTPREPEADPDLDRAPLEPEEAAAAPTLPPVEEPIQRRLNELLSGRKETVEEPAPARPEPPNPYQEPEKVYLSRGDDSSLRAMPLEGPEDKLSSSAKGAGKAALGEGLRRALTPLAGGRVLGIFLLVLVVVAGGYGLVVFAQRADLPALPVAPAATDEPTPEPATAAPTTTARPTGAVLPEPTPENTQPVISEGEGVCVPWEEVTLDQVGQELCVYGELKRWYATSELPFVAVFSEEAGAFIMVDREGDHPEVSPGMCIRAVGEIEVFGGVRPYINADGKVLPCESVP